MPNKVPVMEAVERTWRRSVVATRSPVENLAEEIDEEEDRAMEEAWAEDWELED